MASPPPAAVSSGGWYPADESKKSTEHAEESQASSSWASSPSKVVGQLALAVDDDWERRPRRLPYLPSSGTGSNGSTTTPSRPVDANDDDGTRSAKGDTVAAASFAMRPAADDDDDDDDASIGQPLFLSTNVLLRGGVRVIMMSVATFTGVGVYRSGLPANASFFPLPTHLSG
jgi:hypothetical protein